MTKDVKNSKKHFFRYIGQQRKIKETVPALMSKTGDQGTTIMEKAEVLNFLDLVFTSKCSSHAAHFTELKVRD